MHLFGKKRLMGLLCVVLVSTVLTSNLRAESGTFVHNSKDLTPLESQEELPGKKGKILGEVTGKVIADNSGQPVSYASVALLTQKDSAMVSGVITNQDGTFAFKDVPFGDYDIRVSFVGYKSQTIKGVKLSRKSRKIELEPTKLSRDVTLLDEVVFTGERLKGEEKIDRTTFTLNEDLRKISTNGLDVLKHIPSVQVDLQENVTMDGNGNIQFYVDGVLRNQDYVAQLDAKNIDKVEIITNPGVKYDADVSGVINIVMKKTKRYGLNGSVTVPIPHPTKILVNPKANLEYGNSKFRLYGGGRFHYEKFNGNEELVTITDESFVNPYTNYKYSEGDISWMNGYANYGIDWFVSEKTTLNFLGEYRNGRGVQKDYFSTSKRYENDILTQYFTTNMNAKEYRDNHYLSLFLKQKMPGEESELTAEAYVYLHNSEQNNQYEDIYYDPLDTERIINQINRKDLTLNTSNTAEGRLDYSFVFKKVKNELGARSYYQWMNNDFADGPVNESPDGIYTDNFKYSEQRQTGYYNLLGNIKGISWQAGVRGEYSYLDINDTVMKDYFVFLPQVSLSYKFGKENTAKFSFRRQIHRPSVQSLNPFTTWMDSLHVRTGNPNLDPAIENKFELSYAKNFNNNYISPKIYLRYTKDNIQDLSIVNDEGITEITQANIGEDLEYGVGLNAAIQVLKRWRINGNLSVYNKRVGSEYALSLEDDNQKVSYRVSGTSIFMLPKEFTVFVFGFYNSPYISYQREHRRDLLVIFGAEKQLGKKAKVEFFYNPFIKDFTYAQVITQSPGYYENWRGYLDVHHIYAIEFTYNFSYGRKVKKADRKADYEVDTDGGTF